MDAIDNGGQQRPGREALFFFPPVPLGKVVGKGYLFQVGSSGMTSTVPGIFGTYLGYLR
jgi:hypothetical protein